MEKVSRDDAMKRIEFQFADQLLRTFVERVALSSDKVDWTGLNLDEKKVEHWNLVVRIAKLYMTVLSSLSEDVLKTIDKTKGNLFKLNKFLALRQLAETQLTGITQGTWDLDETVINKKLFSEQVARINCVVTREEIIEKVCEEFDPSSVENLDS